MRASLGDDVAHSMALKVVLGLGCIVVLILVGVRLETFAAFAVAFEQRAPLLLVEPGILGDCVLVLAIAAAPRVLLLRKSWRVAACGVLPAATLIGIGVSGTLGARGGSWSSGTPLASLLKSRGYTRCPATDRIRGSGRATRGEYVADGWAQPDACPAGDGASAGPSPQ